MEDLKRPGRLRLVYRVGEATTSPNPASEKGVDFVVIPGVWTENSPGRMKGSCSWVRPLSTCISGDTRVFLFTYQLEVDGSSLWYQLLSQSYALLSELDESRAAPGQHPRPILFICHSLGGLILKRALTLGVRSRQAYQDATCGIIFLGSPHLVTPTANGWGVVRLLMKANRKDISKQNMTEYELESVLSACRQFEELQLTIPILSVYETKETKFKENIFQTVRQKNNSTKVLVTQAMVQIRASRETLLPVHRTHIELIDIEDKDPLYTQIVQFFKMFIQHAPKTAQYAFRQVPPMEFENPALRARSSLGSFSDFSPQSPDRTFLTPGTAASALPATKADSSGSGDGYRIQTPETGSNNSRGPAQDVLSQAEPASGPMEEGPAGPVTQASPYPPGDEPESAASPDEDGVKLPLAHTGSITRNLRFYGREDVLDEIDYAFGLRNRPGSLQPAAGGSEQEMSDGIPRTFILCGMAGIGKTETASEYLYSRRDQFDVVIWVYADTTRKLGAQFTTLAKQLSQNVDVDALDEVSARDLVMGWLANPRGYRTVCGRPVRVEEVKWLMVFDNADVPDVLYDWLPSQGQGCILITSKYPFVKERAYRLDRGIDMETLPPAVGGDMLRKLAGREDDADAMSASIRISKALGGLPLAISQMSAIIREQHLTFKDFEDWYGENAAELHHLRAGGLQNTYQHTIGTAWAIERLSDPARALLNVLALLDPDRIPEELLIDGAGDVELPDYPKSKHKYFSTRAELIHTSLVTRNMATNELRIHRLVQDVIRHKMDRATSHAVFSAVAVLLSAVWPWVSGTDPTRNQASRVPIAERFTPHICKLEELFGPDVRAGKSSGTAMSGCIFSSYAWYVSERGLVQQTHAFAALSQVILRKALCDEPEKKERITHWLGEAHHCSSLSAVLLGTSDGLEDANTWIGILHERIKSKYDENADRLALATAYNQIGLCYAGLERIEDAMTSFRKSLDTFKSVDCAPQFSGTYAAISFALLSTLHGEPDAAEETLRPMLEEHESALGKDDTTTSGSGHIWHAMGQIRRAQGRLGEALEYHERALQNIIITAGDKHYFTGDFHYCVAVDLLQQGDRSNKAIKHLDNAIEIFTAVSGRDSMAARALWRKGVVLQELGDGPGSRQFFERAMELRHKLVPDDKRPVEDLVDNDWSKLIMFWCR